MSDTVSRSSKQANPLFELLINIVIPTVILSFLSKDQYLGNKLALVVALAFPIGYGCKELISAQKINFFHSGCGYRGAHRRHGPAGD